MHASQLRLRSACKHRATVTCKKMCLCSVLEGCVSAHLPDVEFGLESMRRVDVQSKGAINDGRPGRSGCRTAPPAPSAATRVTRLRGPKWPSFGACSLSHLQSSTQERRKTAGSPPKPPWIHRRGPSAWCRTGVVRLTAAAPPQPHSTLADLRVVYVCQTFDVTVGNLMSGSNATRLYTR